MVDSFAVLLDENECQQMLVEWRKTIHAKIRVTRPKRCVNGERNERECENARASRVVLWRTTEARALEIYILLPSLLILLHQLHLIDILKTMFSIFRM